MGMVKTLVLTLREMGKPESSGKREWVGPCWHSIFFTCWARIGLKGRGGGS